MNLNNVLKLDEWQIDEGFYKLDISLIDERIIKSTPSGSTVLRTTNMFLDSFNMVLKETDKDIILIDDFTKIEKATLEARRSYIKELANHPRILAIIYIGLSPSFYLTVSIGTKLNFLNTPIIFAENDKDAIDLALDYLVRDKKRFKKNQVSIDNYVLSKLEEDVNISGIPKKVLKFEYKLLSRFVRFYKKENYQFNKTRIKQFNLKSITKGLSIIENDSWNYNSKDYNLKIKLIFNSIIYIEQSGNINRENMKFRLNIINEILSTVTNDIIVIDEVGRVNKFSKDAKKIYINYFKKHPRVKAFVYIKVDTFSEYYFNIFLGRLLNLVEYPIIMVNSYEEALAFVLNFLTTDRSVSLLKEDYLNIINYVKEIKTFKKGEIAIENFKNLFIDSLNNRYITEMNNYLLSIDWGDTNSELENSVSKNHPFKFLYESLGIIKSDVNELIKKYQRKENELIKTKKNLEIFNRNLDKTVIERTKELNDSNIILEKEIIKRKKIEEKIKIAKESAINANKNKSIFLANVSHELKTPIHAILSYSNITIRKLDRLDDDKIKSFLNKISLSGERLSRLLDDLIDLSLLESGELTYKIERINFIDVIDNSIPEIITIAKEKDIEIVIDVPKDFKFCLRIDKNRIIQVMNNILLNAIKFSPKKSEIILKLDRFKDDIRVRVIDQGAGISEDELSLIFEEFKRGRKTKEKGTGLGLAISKKIIEYHNGKIWVTNNKDIGATFTFTLPECKNE